MPAAGWLLNFKGRDRHARTFYLCHLPTTTARYPQRRSFPFASAFESTSPYHKCRQIDRPRTATALRRRPRELLIRGDIPPFHSAHLDPDHHVKSQWGSEGMDWITQEIRVLGWHYQILVERSVWGYVSERDVYMETKALTDILL